MFLYGFFTLSTCSSFEFLHVLLAIHVCELRQKERKGERREELHEQESTLFFSVSLYSSLLAINHHITSNYNQIRNRILTSLLSVLFCSVHRSNTNRSSNRSGSTTTTICLSLFVLVFLWT